jgi:hypothetical protein
VIDDGETVNFRFFFGILLLFMLRKYYIVQELRGSTLIQVARRRSKVFQKFSASLVRVEDVQGVSRRHAVRGKKVHHMVFGGR